MPVLYPGALSHSSKLRPSPNPPRLSLGFINIRSCRYKSNFISHLLSYHHLSFLCLVETWLLDSDVSSFISNIPPSFSFLHVSRPTFKSGGGVGCVFPKSITVSLLSDRFPVFSSFEFLPCSFFQGTTEFCLLIIYRHSHPGTTSLFFPNSLHSLNQFSSPSLVAFLFSVTLISGLILLHLTFILPNSCLLFTIMALFASTLYLRISLATHLILFYFLPPFSPLTLILLKLSLFLLILL